MTCARYGSCAHAASGSSKGGWWPTGPSTKSSTGILNRLVLRQWRADTVGASSHFDGPPEPLLRTCRDRIDREAPADERENLLAVTQLLARLRYNDSRLFELFGGRQAMIESPVLQELKAEWTREKRHAGTSLGFWQLALESKSSS